MPDDVRTRIESGLAWTDLGHEYLVIDGVKHRVSHEIFLLAKWLAGFIKMLRDDLKDNPHA